MSSGPPLPKLPPIPPSPIKPLREMVRQGREQVKRAGDDVRSIADDIRGGATATPSREASNAEAVVEMPTGASDQTTLKYQLDKIIDDLEHLETEHLPYQGRLDGEPCDCIAKAARSLRRHAVETIPIVSRQGKEAKIFSEMRDWSQHLVDIGTVNQVVTGKYDEEYLRQAGSASAYRKQIERMFTEIGASSSDCPGCDEAREKLSEFIDRRKKQRAGGETIA